MKDSMMISDMDQSRNEIIYASKTHKIAKQVQPGQIEFMMHTMSKRNVTNFKRGVKCVQREVIRQANQNINMHDQQ